MRVRRVLSLLLVLAVAGWLGAQVFMITRPIPIFKMVPVGPESEVYRSFEATVPDGPPHRAELLRSARVPKPLSPAEAELARRETKRFVWAIRLSSWWRPMRIERITVVTAGAYIRTRPLLGAPRHLHVSMHDDGDFFISEFE